MRTTLTLDPDVVRLLEDAVHRERKPFKQVVNDAIRKGLAPRTGRPRVRYRVRPHDSTLVPGVDRDALNRLADALEDEGLWARALRDSAGGKAAERGRRRKQR